MANVVKKATNLAGLAVAKNPKHCLKIYYKKISVVLDKMPDNSMYKKHTLSVLQQRSNIINSASSIEEMEEKIGCGEIEEVIIQAQNELALAQTFLLSKPWEKLVEDIPENQWTWPPK